MREAAILQVLDLDKCTPAPRGWQSRELDQKWVESLVESMKSNITAGISVPLENLILTLNEEEHKGEHFANRENLSKWIHDGYERGQNRFQHLRWYILGGQHQHAAIQKVIKDVGEEKFRKYYSVQAIYYVGLPQELAFQIAQEDNRARSRVLKAKWFDNVIVMRDIYEKFCEHTEVGTHNKGSLAEVKEKMLPYFDDTQWRKNNNIPPGAPVDPKKKGSLLQTADPTFQRVLVHKQVWDLHLEMWEKYKIGALKGMKKVESEQDFKDWNGKTFVDFQGLETVEIVRIFKKIVDGDLSLTDGVQQAKHTKSWKRMLEEVVKVPPEDSSTAACESQVRWGVNLIRCIRCSTC